MSKKPQILIAGAGLGGLTAAACLLKKGYPVRVYEVAPELAEIGAGIQNSANAVRVLYDLGLKDALEKVIVRPQAYNFRQYDSGEIIQSMPLGETHEQRFGAPYYQIHRADFHNILVDKVRSLDPDCITLNAEAVGFEEDENGVTLLLADGRRMDGDVLIGADGIKSAIRRQIAGDQPADYTGQVAWRALIQAADLPCNFLEPNVDVWCGPGNHAVIYYLRGGDILNFVGLVAHEGWSEEGWTIKRPWADLKADYAGWHPTIQTIIDAADKDHCYRWALNNRKALPFWSTRRTTLLGDSAHPTLPYLAQGAVMAIEDSAVLSRCLEQCSDITAALDLYQRNRIDRTTRIVNESSANADLFQKRNVEDLKAAFAARNIDKERSDWLYSYDALTVPLL
jgi:salicylate hydroxylase